MNLKLKNDVELCWATPVFMFSWSDAEAINVELKALILERKALQSALDRSNSGGWQSTDDLMKWPSEAVQTFQEWVVDAFQKATQKTGRGQDYTGKIQISGWANVNGPGDFNEVHTHPHCAWSGVYYVDVDTETADSERSGFISFIDPRRGADMCPDPFALFGKGRQMRPQNGQMLLFPSWLQHSVTAYRGASERISIAFNIVLLDLM